MSSSIIEAKFQALDRTIRLISNTGLRTKVSSSDQLRDLVFTQRTGAAASTIGTSSRQTPSHGEMATAASRPNTARKQRLMPARVPVGTPGSSQGTGSARGDSRASLHSRQSSQADGLSRHAGPEWTDPVQTRTQQLLQNAWQEIESAVRGDRRHTSPVGDERFPASSALTHRASRDASPTELTISDSTSSQSANQAPAQSRVPGPVSNQYDDCAPRPSSVRPTSSSSLKTAALFERHEAQRAKAMGILPARKPPGRNWFATPAPRSAQSKKTRKVLPHHTPQASPSAAEIDAAAVEYAQSCEVESSYGQANDPSFYFLEVRLEHGSPLVDWRFRASFTDLSVVSRPSVTVDNVPVDGENCLLFATINPQGSPVVVKYFDAVRHFPHVQRPRDLYGHCIRILVVSISPVERVVIDTLVHFLVDDGSSHMGAASPADPAKSNATRSPQRKTEKLELVLPRPSTAGADSDCCPWEDSDQEPIDDSAETARSDRSTAEPCSTMDKKKTELKQMRANMRRKLREERQQLSRDSLAPRQPRR